MERILSKTLILAIVACAAPSSRAEEPLPIRNCTWCHGASARGFATAPRLAGQKSQYIESALQSFKDHSRDNPYSQQYMWAAVGNISAQTAHDFADYFATLPSEPANDGNAALVVEGKTIYEQGIAEANIVSCLVCHGPNAEGFEGIPRLGGLSYAYLKERLEQWAEGFHATGEPMPRVARKLSASEIEAIASYLSFVK